MKKIILMTLFLSVIAGNSNALNSDDWRKLIAEKKYSEAIPLLELETHSHPGSSEILLNLGWAYWHAHRIDDAYHVALTLFNINPQNPVFLIFLANTDIERKDYQTAIDLADHALKLAPDNNEASSVLARALFLNGQKNEALSVINKTIKLFPDDSAAIYRKTEFLSETGHKQEALDLLNKLISIDPTNTAYHRARARILSDLGHQNKAKNEWKNLVRKNLDAQSLMNLGWMYWSEKKYDKAWKISVILVNIDGNNPNFLRFKANIEIQRMHYQRALRLAQKAFKLAPQELNVQLMLAKALFRMQRENEAMPILKKLIAKYPNDQVIQYRWAEFLSLTGSPKESLVYFDQLINADPSNETYHLERGTDLYEMGRFHSAISEWKALALQNTPNMNAVRLLRDDAFNRERWENAEKWQKMIIANNPSEPLNWEKLSMIESALHLQSEAIAAADNAIKVDSQAINAYYIKGDILEQMGNWNAAERAYEQAIKLNSNSARGLDGLSYALEDQGHYRYALNVLEGIKKMTAPTVSPYLELHEASLLSDSGHLNKAHKILKRLEADHSTVIPALLYHGLSPFDRSDSISQKSFHNQMRMLKKNGYHTITVSEFYRAFKGKFILPKKPILITFDDGRTDSFENADPVLKEMGFRATMFVHLSKLRKPHFHASPEDIKKWEATGRWEMQCHGFQSHDPTPIDASGRKGHFLANRIWLADKNRIETLEEYRARVNQEYENAKQGLEDIVPGQEIVAFAYPFGDYGQNDYSNTPEAVSINHALVKKYFHLAFVQDQHGINTLSSNPLDLHRFEPTRYMTSEQLLSHIEISDPRVQAELMDAQLWIRADQIGQAKGIYAELEKQGIHEPSLLAAEGVAFQKDGDLSDAQNLFSKAAAEEPDKNGPPGGLDQKLIMQSGHAAAPVISAEAQDFTDSDTNAISKEMLRTTFLIKSLRLGAWTGYGEYSDKLTPVPSLQHIWGQENGLQAQWYTTPNLEFDGFYARRTFSGGATGFSNNYSAGASYQITPSLKLALRDGMGNIETAFAIRTGLDFHSDDVEATWDPALNWEGDANYYHSTYTDSNLEQDIRLRLTRKISDNISFGLDYLNANSNFSEVDYYTPVGLRQYTGVITLNQTMGQLNPRTGLAPVEALLQYEGGYGFQPAGSSVVDLLKGVMTYRPYDRVTLTLNLQFEKSPLYISRSIDGTIGVSF